MKIAYLVIAHGSREEEAAHAFANFLARFRKVMPNRLIEGAFLELTKPSIPEGIESCVSAGATEIVLLPLMFFPGRHVKTDIPKLIEEAKARYPAVDFHYAGSIADHPLMFALLEDKVKGLLSRVNPSNK